VAAVDLIATLGGLVLKFILMATLALATSAAAQSSLERCDYLVNAVMACDGCHTPRGPAGFVMEKRFSGGSQTWDDPAYTVKGSNITPDPDTGIGRWSESDIKISLTEGLRPYGMPLAPQMLFIFYKIMTPRDLDSVVTYLRSVPAVKNSVQPPVYRASSSLDRGDVDEHVFAACLRLNESIAFGEPTSPRRVPLSLSRVTIRRILF
jgi:hypothetical protein